MSMGAYNADKMVSSRKLAVTPMTPPAPRRMRFVNSARMSPSIFGINSTSMLNQNSAIMSATSNRGHVGNS